MAGAADACARILWFVQRETARYEKLAREEPWETSAREFLAPFLAPRIADTF